MSDDTTTNFDTDGDLDSVKPQAPRLPTLEVGDYKLALQKIVHVDGESGVFDIFEVNILEARGETANAVGSGAKISFKRDERGAKKEMADKKLASALQAINGGTSPESNSAYIRGLRANPVGTFRVRATTETAEKSGNEYKKLTFLGG